MSVDVPAFSCQPDHGASNSPWKQSHILPEQYGFMPLSQRPERITYLSLRTDFSMICSELRNDKCCECVTVQPAYQERC